MTAQWETNSVAVVGGGRGLPSPAEWEDEAQRRSEEGQFFLAYDLAKKGMELYPRSQKLKQIAALALMNTGALDEARALLEPLCPSVITDENANTKRLADLRTLLQSLTHAPPANGTTGSASDTETLQMLARMLREIEGSEPATDTTTDAPDAESLGLLARLYKEQWKTTKDGDAARRSHRIYQHSFETTGSIWAGINAATMSWLIGEPETAQTLARQTLARCREIQAEGSEEDPYWVQATLGEALLLLGHDAEAEAAYATAAHQSGRQYGKLISTRNQLRLLAEHGFPVPNTLFSLLKPPMVVVAIGHMIDAPNRAVPRFPAGIETAARAAIEHKLDEIDARIGYCSAACGADLLFIEAMLARGGEVNIVLPFSKSDFIRTSVAVGGAHWVTRFENALKLATSVSYVTEEPLLGDDVLYAFLAQIFQGYAELRARALHTRPYLLALWDGSATGPIGGTADLVSRWADLDRLLVVPTRPLLDALPTPPTRTEDLRIQAKAKPSVAPGLEKAAGKRRIKTMLFADVVGYSKLQEERIPFFMFDFLETIARQLSPAAPFVNTWGDALFVVMDSATPMAQYALALQEAVCSTSWPDLGLPEGLSVRIGLHAGPVFEAVDPITNRLNYYGAHVNRAARLEPVTIPGHIYATEQFVALLTSEQVAEEISQQSAKASQTEADDDPADKAPVPEWVCEYVGTLSLAKNYGSQVAYHLRRRQSTASEKCSSE